MKRLYTSFLTGLFLLLFTLPLMAQTPIPLGSKAELITKFKALPQGQKHLKVRQQLPEKEAVELQVNYSKKENGADVIAGEVVGKKNGTFYLKANEQELSGYIILREQKEAYKYYMKENGAVFLEQVDIDKVICVEYEKGPQQDDASGMNPKGGSVAMAIPMLESLPGAAHVVLLDFDGQVVTSPHWNGGTTINAQPAAFTDAVAIEVWKIMAEDFRPWAINITTNEAVFNAVPQSQRMRVIFTPTDDAYPGVGGVAYVNSFTAGDDYPCWVFNSGIKGAGDAGSHEVGHTLGLVHDGRSSPVEEYYQGHDDWAPIMGSSYYRNLAQWSKGEYTNANNSEDDLNIIATINGFGYRGDDHGNTNGTATALSSAASGSVSAGANKGFIGSTSDVDVFSFSTGAGTITLNVNPDSDYPNIDIGITLRNSGGGVVATASPGGFSATINQTVPAGTYYLSVDGVQGSDGAQSDYGSLGAYAISGYVVNDVTPPVLSGVPANTSASCDNIPAPPTVTANDAIDGIVPVTYNQTTTPGSCPGNYTLTRTWSATDAAGNTASANQHITVSDNTGPVLTGVPSVITAQVADGRCEAEVTYPGITAVDNCSNATISYSTASGSTFPLGITTVTVSAEDECGNLTEATFDVEIINDAPVITSITAPLDPQPVNQLVSTSATFVDNNLTSASWDWGDGSPATAGIISGNSITGSHTYTSAGIYTLELTLEDACAASVAQLYQYVVVYDPSAGFVTGGGWIYSPAGAYQPDPFAEGKASFGFVSKYQKGATVPKGNTAFEFAAANLHFESTAYEWLVISSDFKAQYKGVGQLNGVDGYGFSLSAVDGEKKSATEPDRIRIKIWDAAGTTVYDNQISDAFDAEASMALGGGSIVIHTGRSKNATSSARMEQETATLKFTAYPNPLQAEGLWLVFPAAEGHEEVKAGIYNLAGKLVESTSFTPEKGQSEQLWQIDHSPWSSGMYILIIESNTLRRQVKLLKP